MAKGPREGYSLRRDIEVPQLQSRGDVVLAVESCGVCASDAKMYKADTDFYWDVNIGRVMGGKGPDFAGVVPGHEFVGTVVESGEAAVEARDKTVVSGSSTKPLATTRLST